MLTYIYISVFGIQVIFSYFMQIHGKILDYISNKFVDLKAKLRIKNIRQDIFLDRISTICNFDPGTLKTKHCLCFYRNMVDGNELETSNVCSLNLYFSTNILLRLKKYQANTY